MANGLLIAGFNYRNVAQDEFNDWYDTEHVPERSRVPGFLNCQRWLGAEDAKISIATYDLANLAVLQSPQYRAIAYENLSPWSKRVVGRCERLMRYEGEQTLPGTQVAPPAAGALLLNAMNAAPEGEAEFNRWYDEEHIPALAAVPGVLCARRFRAASTTLQKYVALYHMTSAQVCASAAWAKAVETPWTEKIRPYMRDRLRIVCKAYVRSG
jgi:hypothetical protein